MTKDEVIKYLDEYANEPNVDPEDRLMLDQQEAKEIADYLREPVNADS